MKHYIILTPTIANMGGAQMYTNNKCSFLSKFGWNPVVVYFKKGNVLINGLLKYESNYVPEIGNGIQYYSKSDINSVIEKIGLLVPHNSEDEIVVESQLQLLSFWGELLSQNIHAKHILNCLEEDIPKCTYRTARFFEYKLYRHECLNASINPLKRLFQQFYKEEYSKYEFKSSFPCSNVTDDSLNDVYPQRVATFTILSVGRLDKPYISYVIQQIKKFVDNNQEYTLNLMFVGASPNGKVEKDIDKLFSSCTNVVVYHYGYMFPIPTCLVKKANIAIATSNSVLVPYNVGVPTLAVDAADGSVIGLYGVTTMNKVFRREEEYIPLTQWLSKVLINKEYINIIPELNEQDLDSAFQRQVDFIQNSNISIEYYDVMSAYSRFERFICIMKRTISSLLRI